MMLYGVKTYTVLDTGCFKLYTLYPRNYLADRMESLGYMNSILS